MEDAELTRLAIAEIVREMGELKEPQVQERKINPIAKPNKRFLGRTLNSMLSHNKRENDRTQENCRKKLKELDEKRNENKSMKSSNRSASCELVLSSSTEEDRTKYVKKRRKRDKKSKSKKSKKRKKVRDESKKRKSSRYDSSDSCRSSSRGTSRSRSRSKSGRSRKSLKHKIHKDHESHLNGNEEEREQTYCEPDMSAALQLEAALMSNSYRQHQIQQLLYYSALMAGNETSEIDTLQEELQISDVDIFEPQVDIKSISSAISSSNLEEGDSEVSEILQISLSSATSTSSKAQSSKNLWRKHVKEKESQKKSELSDSSSGVIWELNSESSKACTYSKKLNPNEKQEANNECICIGSETDTDTHNETDSDNTTSDTEIGSENVTNVPNNVCHAAAETVTLLSSSDSEVEIVTDINANSPAQRYTGIDSAVIAAHPTENLLKSLENITETDGLPSLKNTTILDVSTKVILTSPHQTRTNLIEEPSMEEVAEESSLVTASETSFTISTEHVLSEAPAPATDVNVFTAERKSTIEDVTILSADIDKFASESQPTSEGIGLEQAQEVNTAIVEESEFSEEITPSTVTKESSNTNIITTGRRLSLGNVTISSVDIEKFALEPLTTICIEEAKPTKGRIPDADLLVSESNLASIGVQLEQGSGEVVMESMTIAEAETPPTLSILPNSDSSCNSSSKTSATPLSTDLESDAIENENKSGIVSSELDDRQVSSLDNVPYSAPS